MAQLGAKVQDPALLAELNGTAAPADAGQPPAPPDTAQPTAAPFQGGSVIDPAKVKTQASKEQIIAAGKDPTKTYEINQLGDWTEIGTAITPGQKAADVAFGKDYEAWTAGGGFANTLKQLSQLGNVSERLGAATKPGAKESLTGPLIGITPDWVNSWFNQPAIDVRETVHDVAQRSLRQILGAQFTEKEGERLINKAYNPSLNESVNKVRVYRLMKQLEIAAQEKDNASRYFEQNGTLAGWKGKSAWTVDDFNPEQPVEGEDGNKAAAAATTPPPPPPPPPAGPTPLGPGETADIGFDAPAPEKNPWTPEQQASYTAFVKANPKASKEQIDAWATAHGAQISNSQAIADAMAKGAGAAPGSAAIRGLSAEDQATADRIASEQTPDQAAAIAAIHATPFVDKIANAVNAAEESLQGKGSFSERYGAQTRIGESINRQLEEQHPVAYPLGELGSAMAIPTGIEGVAFKAAREALQAGKTRAEAMKIARMAAAGRMGKEGAVYGAVQGADQADSPGQLIPSTIAGAVEGGVGTTALGVAGAKLAPKLNPFARRGIDEVDTAAARAGQEMGVDVPKAVVGGPAARGAGQNAIKRGSTQMTAATSRMLDQSAEKLGQIGDTAAGSAAPRTDILAGEAALKGGNQASASWKRRIQNLYRLAENDTKGVVGVKALKTAQTLQDIIGTESEALGGTAVGDVFRNLADDLANNKNGQLTIAGARQTRSTLRDSLTAAGLTMRNADRLTNHVMTAITEDMKNGLSSVGKDSAFKMWSRADQQWGQLQDLEKNVLEPYIGKDGEKNADEVARLLGTDVRGKGIRLAKFLNAVPEAQANSIRARLLDHLSEATPGQQGAAGETSSLDNLLTNWNKIKNSRNLIFSKETVHALNRMAEIAEAAKRFSKGREPSGRTLQAAAGGVAAVTGGALGYQAGGGWGTAGGSIALPLAIALSRGNAARLLASPKFAERLARTPKNPAAAKAYWERPGVAALARSEPELANEILGFRDDLLNATGQGDQPAPQAQQ